MPGNLQGNYSRFMYDETKRYVHPMFQRYLPGVDADFNESMSAFLTQIRRVIEYGIGDGSPNNGFLIAEAPSNVNNFLITGGDGTLDGSGRLFFSGFSFYLPSDTNYTDPSTDIHPQSYLLSETVLTDSSANWTPNELVGRLLTPDVSTPAATYLILSNTATTIQTAGPMVTGGASAGDFYRVELSTPAAPRVDEVYVDTFVDEITEFEDPNLIHPSLIPPIASAYRAQLRQNIRVKEDVGTFGPSPSARFVDADSRVHYYYKIATIARTAVPTVLSAMITDDRQKFNPGGGGITLKELDGTPTIPSVNEIRVNDGSLTDLGSGIGSLDLNNLTIEETDGTPSITHLKKLKVTKGTLTDLGGNEAQLDTGGSSTGDISVGTVFTSDIPAITPPTKGTLGTDINTLDHPDAVITGQKVMFAVPDDYDSGDLELLIGFATGAAVASPNNVIVLRTSGEIADVVTGAITNISQSDDPLTCPDNSTDVTRSSVRSLTAGTFNPGDVVLFNIIRLGTDGGDLLTTTWRTLYYAIRYTGSVAGRIVTLVAEKFDDTDETPPAKGTLGTDINTLDYSASVDNEQKILLVMPDNYDGVSDVYVKLQYAMSSAFAGNVVIETEGEIADVSTGSITSLPVSRYILTPPVDTNPHKTVAVRSISFSNVTAGSGILVKIARRGSDGADTHTGLFKLISAYAVVGVAPSSGITAVTIWSTYLEFAGTGTPTGTISGVRGYPIYGGDFEGWWIISSLSAGATLPIAFAGRLAADQTMIRSIKIPLKGSAAGVGYRVRIYVDGQGASAVYDSGSLTTVDANRFVLDLNDTDLSSQPNGEKRYFVDVLATCDNAEILYVARPFVIQE